MLLLMVSNLPHANIGIEIVELLIRSKLCSSKSQARRAINEGAIKISNEKVTDPYARIFLYENRYILLEGKRNERNTD